MPYEPIHHKYRPQTFKDLVGQETIALTLSNALKQEKIAPAYLFTGPRGTGKTSSARILAKSLNCLNSDRPTPEPCGECEACMAIAKGTALDVTEIDAASNTGVDNIREIIERSRFAPVQCRYKIYAIDECHMLSTAAFNALLKTLEEPPPQVVFILATTDPQRVLSTIISRCQRFDYRRIPLPEMVSHLKYIAESEGIAIADDALTLIAQIANGGLRDAESLLDQLSLLPDTISVAKVWDLVGAVPEQDLLKLLRAINSNDSLGVLQQCRSLLDRGREPIVVLQNLASFYLNLLIAKTAPQHPDMVAVTETCWQQLCTEAANWDTGLILRGQQHLKEAETQLRHTTQPRLWLEVTLLSLLPEAHRIATSPQPVTKTVTIPVNNLRVKEQPLQNNGNIQTVSNNSQLSQESVAKASQTIQAPVNNSVSPEPIVESTPQPPATNTDVKDIWNKVVSCLQPPTTQALLKQQCHLVSFDGNSAIVGISSAKLQKLNQGKIPNIEKAFALVVQHKVKVQLEVAHADQNLAKKNFEPLKSIEAPPTANHNSSSATKTEPTPHKTTEPKPLKPNDNPPTTDSSTHQPPTLPSTPLVANNSATAFDIEPNLDDDDDLQKAIATLTQNFEGELVQLDDTNQTIEIYETTKPTESIYLQDRPSLEDYDDVW